MKNDLRAEHLAQEVTLTLPLSAVLRLAEPSAAVAPTEQLVDAEAMPRIGEAYRDGIFAGLTIHENDVFELVLLPGDEKLSWHDAVAWAEKQGGTLPSRIDQLALLKNLKSEFKEAWYWSGEQFAGGSDYAWSQNFGNGRQYGGHKDDVFRARAVRRLPIQ